MPDDPKTDLVHTISTTVTTVAGLAAVVFLALHGDIHDGETVAGISAVLGIQLGLGSLRKPPPAG